MAAVSLAILGKDNDPLYVREFFRGRSSGGDGDDHGIAEEELFGLVPPSANGGGSAAASDEEEEEESGNVPLGTRGSSNNSNDSCSLRQQFVLHAALDRFEQLSGPPPGYAWRKQGQVGKDASKYMYGDILVACARKWTR